MRRGDIYMVSLDPSAGHEQKGFRPVLIISPHGFNKLTKTPVILPITTGGAFARTAGFTVELNNCKTVGYVRCDQPRALDLQSRKAKKVESISEDILDHILAKLGTIMC